jgi:hypothetical protein
MAKAHITFWQGELTSGGKSSHYLWQGELKIDQSETRIACGSHYC